MGDDRKTPLQYCQDLQNLILITLDWVILPLRTELKKATEYSEILNWEIQDGENKTFEYIAQQMSEIFNADEEVADSILLTYPKSVTCYRCLRIDEDTLHGLLYIRGITFFQLLDMQENEVINILSIYGTSSEDIDHILMGLSKIRSNIDLLESDLPFEDDTRNLIKHVIKLTERIDPANELNHTEDALLIGDPLLSPPLLITEPQDSFEDMQICFETDNISSINQDLIANESNNVSSYIQNTDSYVTEDPSLLPISSVRSASISESHPSSCFSTNAINVPLNFGFNQNTIDLSTQTLNRNSRLSKAPVQLNRFCRALSPVSYRTIASTKVRDFPKTYTTDGGLSVPSTPANTFFGTPVHQKVSVSPAKGTSMSTSFTNVTDGTPPHSPYSVHPGFLPRGSFQKDRGPKMSATPPSKHRLKFSFPLHRSKSHDSNLASKVNFQNATSSTKCGNHSPRNPSKIYNLPISPDMHSPVAGDQNIFCFPTPTHVSHTPSSPKFCSSGVNRVETVFANAPMHNNYLAVPNGGNYMNRLTHRFELEAKLSDFFRGVSCSICNGRLRIRLQHCIYCNMKIHRNCVNAALMTMCPGYQRFGEFEIHRNMIGSGKLTGAATVLPFVADGSMAMGLGSNSASSCTSCSTPGSPFLAEMGGCHGCMGTPSSCRNVPPSSGVTTNTSHVEIHHHHTSQIPTDSFLSPASSSGINPVLNNRLDSSENSCGETIQNGANQRSIRTLSSCESSRTVVEDRLSRLESIESQDENSVFVRTNSLSVTLKEWNIPISNLQLGELIGRGTFGEVYRGKWHGEVAVKVIDFDPHTDPQEGLFSVDAFKREIVTLHKLRHENLVLFMGACMNSPDLAIVTQLCKGETLHYLLHSRKHVLNTNKAISIASQIAKGMGYLHARHIVHRDLKTRNIFIEANYKAVIADFALFNFVKFCKRAKCGNYVHIPPNWLSYVAPEIMRALNIGGADQNLASELPFTHESDVFAFGTVWYEILTCEYPFKGIPTETLVYLVGNGFKSQLQMPVSKDFKEIMRQCWSFNPKMRPEFTALVQLLDRLPKLYRSPSYPTKPQSVVGPVSRYALIV